MSFWRRLWALREASQLGWLHSRGRTTCLEKSRDPVGRCSWCRDFCALALRRLRGAGRLCIWRRAKEKAWSAALQVSICNYNYNLQVLSRHPRRDDHCCHNPQRTWEEKVRSRISTKQMIFFTFIHKKYQRTGSIHPVMCNGPSLKLGWMVVPTSPPSCDSGQRLCRSTLKRPGLLRARRGWPGLPRALRACW